MTLPVASLVPAAADGDALVVLQEESCIRIHAMKRQQKQIPPRQKRPRNEKYFVVAP